MRIISGIYKIVNVKNNKTYIGSSKNIIRRWYIHKSALKNNRHHCIHLQRSWNKHGEQEFKFEIIKEMDHPTEEQLFAEELKHINEMLPQYNIGGVGGGDNLTNNPNRADIIRRMTESLRERMSKMSEEERKEKWSRPGDKNPNWKDGRTFCKCGARISSSAQCCIKCVDYSGPKNSFYGKHHTPEMIEHFRQLGMGRKLSPNTIEKCKNASICFYNSLKGLDYKKKQSETMKGEKHFLYGIGHKEESKRKMSESRKENIKNMSVSERYYWNKMRKVRVVRIHNNYYFSLQEAMKMYKKSEMSLRFRCNSIDEKWKEYEFISLISFSEEQDKTMIQNITKTIQTAIGADNIGPLL